MNINSKFLNEQGGLIGFRADNDRVYPDLAFSLPLAAVCHAHTEKRQRTVVGLGVMAYSVSRRTREIGVRVALGARSADVTAMILGQGLRTIVIGVLIGIAGSLALTRFLQSLLFGVSATDPLTLVLMTLLPANSRRCLLGVRESQCTTLPRLPIGRLR